MKLMNNAKQLAVALMTLWTATGTGLAQLGNTGTSGGPVSASDQQVQAIDLIGKQQQQKVDLFTGSFAYSIPIACAPARNGSEPNLTLGYSSAGDLGWCGMGWDLNIGYIERNTRDGVPIAYSTATPPAPLTQYNDSKGFIMNLSGKELKLFSVATNGTLVEYRAEVDTDFLRCFLDTNNNNWTVYDKGGNAYYFGETTNTRVANPKTGWNGYSGTFRWALDQVVTATGDWTTVGYTNYTSPNTSLPERTLYPTQIIYNGHTTNNTYSANATGANTITFQTELRTNDWRFSYRWGFRTEQCRRLTNILCSVGSQNVWSYRLKYGVSPATGRSLLTNVVVYGYDVNNNATAFLTNSFAYQANPNSVSFGPTIVWSNLVLKTPGISSGSYNPEVAQIDTSGVFNYTIADLVDMDGDGLPDRVAYDASVTPNQYQVQKNLGLQSNGSGSFGTQHAFGPTSTGGGGTASASNPLPDGNLTGGSGYAELNTPYGRIRDINGDGLPDRVMGYWSALNSVNGSTPFVPYTNYEVQVNTGQGFSGVTNWPVSTGPLGPNTNANSGYYYSVESGGINVGFFDINGDGLPDRVMSGWYQNGPMTNFMVQLNTGTNFTQPMVFGPYHSQNYNTPSQTYQYEWAGIEVPIGSSTPEAHMIDINGDGLPDRLMSPMNPSSPGNVLRPTTYYAVEYNNGYAFESTNTSTSVPGAYDQWPGGSGLETANGGTPVDAIENLPYVGLFDVNGDGLPDRVMVNWAADTNTGPTSTSWLVYLNNGHGFNSTPIVVTNIQNQGQNSQSYVPTYWSMQGFVSGSGNVTTLMDVNGDGLLDRVMAVYDNGYNNASSSSNFFLVQLNQGPFPDLMTNVNNGIGGTIGVTYNPSTAYDNRVDTTNPNSVSHMPYPRYVTATVTESDGINPSQTTTYGYGGGYYDGPRREFHGFAVVTNTDPTLRYTVTYFHTGGGRNYAALGEYQDTNSTTGLGNFAKAGMAYRIETYGNDNNLYHVTVNQVDQSSLGNGRYFPFTTLSFDCDYPGGGTPKVTATDFNYDTNTFNLTNKVEYGLVTGFNPSSVGSFTFTDTNSADNRYYNTHFTPVGTYIVDHPDTVVLADVNNNTIRETDYSYNPGGTLATKLTRIAAGYYATNSYANYTSYGLVGQITDPVGVQTTITYDSTYNTYPATTTVGGTFNTTTAYDPRSGQLALSTDPTGLTVSNSFDSFCRPTEVDKIPIGGGSAIWQKIISYPSVLGPIVSGSAVNYVDVLDNDGIGGVESRTYIDGFGRPIQTRTQGENGNFRVVSIAYDGRGNVFLTTWPVFGTGASFTKPTSGLTASWTGFDAAGRVATNRPVNVTFSNGAFSSASTLAGDTGSPLAAKTWSYVNGSDPWWVICTDEDNQVRKYQLDAFGRTNQIQEVDGSSTYTNTLNYDLADDLTNLVNANGENIYWAFNDAGDVVAMADRYLGQWTYQRDYAGRLRVQTDARGDVIQLSYINPATGQQDPLGRLQTKLVYSTNYTAHTLTLYAAVTNIYDSSTDGNYTVYPGLLFETIDKQGYEKTGYDTRARTIKTARYLNINSNTYTTSYTLDDGDNTTAIAYPNSGPTVNYSYFHGGSISNVWLNGTSYSYYTAPATAFDEFEHITNFTYGSGLTVGRGYYATSKRLQNISAGSGGSVFNRSFQYTAGDDITSLSGTGLTNTTTVTYYNLHRIKTYTGLTGNYGYDPTGNITNNVEGGGSSYAYANPRIQAVRTAFGYTNLYDLCGNMMVRHGGLTNSQALTYDPENQLSAIAQAGVMSDEFGYADDGARLWKRIDQNPTNIQVWIGNIYEEKGGKVLYHVFAGSEQVCTFETNSPLFGGTDTNRVGYYYHEDNLNTSSALSGSSGSQVEVNVYYPFGRTQTATPQASFQVSRRFTGQVFDSESGLYYYNARYYDPELGRFIQPDTEIPDLSNPQSYNRYSYVMNDPLRYNDPTGHTPLLFDSEAWEQLLSPVSSAAGNLFNKMFVGGSSAALSDPNSYNVLSGGALGHTIPGVGNPAKAVVKAGGSILVQAGMMMTPAGDEKAAVTVVEDGEKVVSSLEQRAKELHGLLDPQAQRMRTTAVTETKEGVTYVSSSRDTLSPAQRAALKPGEVEATGPGHAEITGINNAKQAGLTPTATAASRPICPTCAQTLKEQGVTPASPLKVPGQ
jgi:RHS repeat-associated protein